MFKPGDVVWLRSAVAGKPKFHLCVHVGGGFLFLNSPKARAYDGDFVVDCAEFPFLEPTPSGQSIISCSMVLRLTARQLAKAGAERRGSCSKALLTRLLKEIEVSAILTEEDRDFLLDGLSDAL